MGFYVITLIFVIIGYMVVSKIWNFCVIKSETNHYLEEIIDKFDNYSILYFSKENNSFMPFEINSVSISFDSTGNFLRPYYVVNTIINKKKLSFDFPNVSFILSVDFRFLLKNLNLFPIYYIWYKKGKSVKQLPAIALDTLYLETTHLKSKKISFSEIENNLFHDFIISYDKEELKDVKIFLKKHFNYSIGELEKNPLYRKMFYQLQSLSENKIIIQNNKEIVLPNKKVTKIISNYEENLFQNFTIVNQSFVDQLIHDINRNIYSSYVPFEDGRRCFNWGDIDLKQATKALKKDFDKDFKLGISIDKACALNIKYKNNFFVIHPVQVRSFFQDIKEQAKNTFIQKHKQYSAFYFMNNEFVPVDIIRTTLLPSIVNEKNFKIDVKLVFSFKFKIKSFTIDIQNTCLLNDKNLLFLPELKTLVKNPNLFSLWKSKKDIHLLNSY